MAVIWTAVLLVCIGIIEGLMWPKALSESNELAWSGPGFFSMTSFNRSRIGQAGPSPQRFTARQYLARTRSLGFLECVLRGVSWYDEFIPAEQLIRTR